MVLCSASLNEGIGRLYTDAFQALHNGNGWLHNLWVFSVQASFHPIPVGAIGILESLGVARKLLGIETFRHRAKPG